MNYYKYLISKGVKNGNAYNFPDQIIYDRGNVVDIIDLIEENNELIMILQVSKNANLNELEEYNLKEISQEEAFEYMKKRVDRHNENNLVYPWAEKIEPSIAHIRSTGRIVFSPKSPYYPKNEPFPEYVPEDDIHIRRFYE